MKRRIAIGSIVLLAASQLADARSLYVDRWSFHKGLLTIDLPSVWKSFTDRRAICSTLDELTEFVRSKGGGSAVSIVRFEERTNLLSISQEVIESESAYVRMRKFLLSSILSCVDRLDELQFSECNDLAETDLRQIRLLQEVRMISFGMCPRIASEGVESLTGVSGLNRLVFSGCKQLLVSPTALKNASLHGIKLDVY